MMQTKSQPLTIPTQNKPTLESSEEGAQTPSSYSSNIGSLITTRTYASDITKNAEFIKPPVHTPPPPEFFRFTKKQVPMQIDNPDHSDSDEEIIAAPTIIFSQAHKALNNRADDSMSVATASSFEIGQFKFDDEDYYTTDSEENLLLANIKSLSASPTL